MRASAIEIDARTELKPDELDGTGLRQLKKLLEDLQLKVASVRFATRRGYETIDELDRRIEGTKRAMKMAYDLGARVVVNSAGKIEEDPDAPSRHILHSVLSDLGKYSQHIGASLGLETGAESLSVLGGMINSLPDNAVGVTLNPGNLIVNGFGLDDLPAVSQRVVLVHAKDGVPDRARGRGTQVPLGRGLADFPKLVATLAEQGFDGYYLVERDLAADPIQEFESSLAYLRGLGF